MAKSITKYYIKPSASSSDVYYIVDRNTDVVEAMTFSENMAKEIIMDYGNIRGKGFEGIPPSFFLFT